MRMTRVMIIGLGLLLAACSKDDGVRHLSSAGDGPDEFRILPSKSLEAPSSYDALPAPTPGAANRTDLDPKGDAVVALGGSRNAVNSTTIPSGDSGLVNYSGRKGRTQDIRTTLAVEDEAYRKKRGRFTNIRIVRTDQYNEVYKREHLNQYEEQERWRRGGAATPAAPPG
ncbi:DUF3035 domain-containing protein [uncultured Shimia sp.]|uniref:DUF3035 domain-containing protein n=1 Tax=uncultured Shimia sp. TaxID=573152 RepID=UPI00262C8855|nr:DUF3035 domain-containing protein [uncultured Shimia sp.]